MFYIAKDNKQYFNNQLAKIMSDVFLYIYFIFKSTKILPYFPASTQHFTGMPEYTMITHDIEYSACILFTYTTKIMYTRLVYSTLYPFLLFQVVCK